MPRLNKWWPKGFRVWKDKKPPFRDRCQHRKSKVMVNLQKFPPCTAAYYEECARIERQHAPNRTKPGTLGALIEKYRASPAFRELAKRTRSDYQGVFNYLSQIQDIALVRFTSPFIVKLRDKAEKQKHPRFATYVKQVLSAMFSWAKERGYMKENPALGVRGVRRKRGLPEANRPWSDAERHAVLAALPVHMVPAMALMMYTGLGPGDALALPKSSYKNGKITTERSKTGVPVYWRVISQLRTILDSMPEHNAITLCANSRGRPWSVSGFRASWRKVRVKLEEQGVVQPRLTLYGLRHTLATILREAGLDERKIADALGQKTEAMARYYSKSANLTSVMDDVSTALENAENIRQTETVKLELEKLSNRKA
jgi:integrase